ncbi:hypothetical protein C8A00DRAFT_38782 [Chaetomidium leptoderma]|uniref:Heterokaryon incompatibility domain-containing protein n=1 Tax=Chaetomidium leptoderma TaxID=669021 RepID=A0AAN6ZSJ7_9PEZI|nr:hypothetical protein C8A00DRAFT_38782 [Chaetomidium leptoderma]
MSSGSFNFNSAPQGAQPFSFSSPPQGSQPFNFNSALQGAQPFSFNSAPGPSQPFNFNTPLQSASFTFSSAPTGNNPFQFTGPIPPPTNPPKPTLCTNCAALDLETAFARAHSLYEGARRRANTRQLVTCRAPNGTVYLRDFYFVTSLGHRLTTAESPATGKCKLCAFFKQHITTTTGDERTTTYTVLAICSSESPLFQPPRKDPSGNWVRRDGWDEELEYNVFLAVVPDVEGVPRTGLPLRWLETELPRHGGIYRLTKPLAGGERPRVTLPRALPAGVDLNWARRWLRVCGRNHGVAGGGCCGPDKPPGATMRGFRVIDCTQAPPVVVEVPWSEKYVAVSYVWGPSTEDWPPTVTDAVHMTKEMGERYLWVDRLCIDQTNVDEKMALISRMDDIYAGAEFTIVNAAGDARTGLPGVLGTQRTVQPRVELAIKPEANSIAATNSEDAYLELLNVPEAEYNKETEGHRMWLDNFRHGLNNVMKIDLNELLAVGNTKDRAKQYGISVDHLDFFEDSAQQLNIPFDEFMEKQQQLATRIGITLPELVPWLQRKVAADAGAPIPDNQPLPPLDRPSQQSQSTTTSPSKPPVPLPLGLTPNKTTLISTMPEPRHTIRQSIWATRGWTYQEGVLATRRIVFTPDQLYWECNGMALAETLELPMKTLHVLSTDRTHRHFADYVLSGVFRGSDSSRHGGGGAVPEMQYGFREEGDKGVDGEVQRLDAHVRAFTGRRLTDGGGFVECFFRRGREGVPVWVGGFADGGTPALGHTFACSVSVWFHVARPVQRRAEFGVSEDEDDEDDEDNQGDNAHVDFFMAMLKPEWVKSVDMLWSAQMVLHSEDGSHSTLVSGHVPNLDEFAGGKNAGKKWLLTIKDPLVLKHLYLMHSSYGGWKRLMGKAVELHLSVPMTEEELTAGHKAGSLVSVLIFASRVPFVWDGRARFLILRKAGDAGERWERIGRLALTMEEWMMSKYKDSGDMVKDLPVRKFGKDITLV